MLVSVMVVMEGRGERENRTRLMAKGIQQQNATSAQEHMCEKECEAWLGGRRDAMTNLDQK